MKKKIIFIFVSVLLMIGVTVYMAINLQKDSVKTFTKGGYILNTESADKDDKNASAVKYYFSANTAYKNSLNNTIEFKDTNGDKVKVPEASFVHYEDDSISLLKKGVILNTKDVTSEVPIYYNLFEGTTLESSGGSYQVDNLGKTLKFDEFVVRVSDNKYLIVSNDLKLRLDGKTTTDIKSNYVEVSVIEEGIIKIENQDSSYQTVATNASIMMGPDLRLNLDNGYFFYKDEATINLNSMIIDSDDNVDITPIEDIVPDEIEDETNAETGQNPDDPNVRVVEEEAASEEGEVGIVNIEQEVVENELRLPTAALGDVDITANRFSGSITINDPDGVITGKTYTTVVENSNSRVVFDKETDAGVYNIDVYAELLTPETSYSLTTTVHYVKNEIEYTMDVIQQLFVTSSIGISLEKDYYTSSELAFICKIDNFSKVKSADVKLLSSSGEVLKEKAVTAEEAKNDDGYRVIFSELQSNTKYSVIVENILYEDDIISSEYSIEKSAKTLKTRPSMGTPAFTMDKKSGAFSLKLNNMIDANSGVDSYVYEVYDARTVSDGGQPLMVIEKSNLSSVNLAIDDSLIKRGIPYTYKVKAVFYDNEKYIEYTTGFSNNMQMDGVESPTITWETNEDAGGITFESIHGFITITDAAGTIDYDKPMTIVYTNSIGTSKSYTVTSGNSIIPFDQNNLRANETYTISVYASVNLMDDNGAVDSYHVGSVILKTKSTRALDVFYNVNTDVVTEAFRVYCKLLNVTGADNTLEANTLSELTFVLYEGPSTSGTVVKTVRKVDRDVREYVSTLKEDYYDNGFYLNADFFGLRSSDLNAENYTIAVQGAKDYTDFQNEIPLTNQTVTVSVNGFVPDPDEDKTWFSNTLIRNKDAGTYDHYDANLGAETIVGIKVVPNFDNTKKYGKYLIIHVWDVTGEWYEVTAQKKTVNFKADGSLEPVYFWFDYGTPSSIDDSTSAILRRGHAYMFSFTGKLDLNNDGIAETDYPATQSKMLKSDFHYIEKQKPTLYVYPSSSTSTSVEVGYSLKDFDKCLYSDYLTANIYNDAGTVLKTSSKAIEITDSRPDNTTFKKVNFTGLEPGLLKISAAIAPLKNDHYSSEVYTNQYFEQEYTLPTINYSLMVDVNRILISINNYDNLQEAIKHIVALKLTFTCEGQSIVKDFVKLNGDNAVVDMYDLGRFINKDITLSVQAYYDTDLIGWDQDNDYFALQAVKDVYGGGEYFTLNSESTLVESDIANGSAFTRTVNTSYRAYYLQQQSNSITEGPTFMFSGYPSKGGIRANGTYFNLKKIAVKNLNSTSAVFSFSQIIPGINLENEDGVLQIAPAIQTVKFDASVYGFGSSTIRDSKIYVQVSKTDDTGSYLERDGEPREFTIDQINDEVCEIDGLVPKQNYALEFYAYIDDGHGGWDYKKLYDLSDNSDQRIYYFKTLTGINIDNIRFYYYAVSYDNKKIRITYDVDRIMGYDRIEYKIYKQITNEITGLPDWELVDVEIPDDVGFRTSMTKYIACNPGSVFEFGSVYKITITPYVDLTIGGEEVHIPLDQDNGELRFNLRSLHAPLVGVTSSVGASSSENGAMLEFKVNIYDTDKVIVGGKYSIYIDDAEGNDVTPAEYATQTYAISTTNRSFVVDNLVEGTTYFFHVVYQRDIYNKGPDYYQDINYRYKANALNNEAVTVGSISATANSVSNNQIDLNFSYSQNITQIDNLRYSIYNSLNGTSFDNDIEFTLNRKTISGTTIYSITLPEYLSSAGIYYLQLQFISEDEVIEEQTVEYSYFG